MQPPSAWPQWCGVSYYALMKRLDKRIEERGGKLPEVGKGGLDASSRF